MSFAIAAAGTGGHVFPGLAVGEALVSAGVPRSDIHYLGGDRLEASVYPQKGFPFHGVAIRGLRRSLSPANLALPVVVARAVRELRSIHRRHGIRVTLGLGGYITVPAAIAARTARSIVMVAEQNADAGLANRIAGRLAVASFGAFPETHGLPHARWVGNPVRPSIAGLDRGAFRPRALDRYELDPRHPVVGVVGGSLGAGLINQAVADTVRSWSGPPIQILHLVGARNEEAMRSVARSIDGRPGVRWRIVGFEEEMEYFYAASDLIVSRAGGAVAEIAVAGIPAILVPGGFGSGGHQNANAAVFEDRGAAVVLNEDHVDGIAPTITRLIQDPDRLESMRTAAASLGRADAASEIARAMMDAHE